MHRTFVPGVVVFAMASVLAGAPARATITISPPQPSVADSVTVTAWSEFPGSYCWTVRAHACAVVPPDTLAVTVPVDWCNGGNGCDCLDFPEHYHRSCTFGPLPAGSYVAKFTERHTNTAYDRAQTFTQYLSFTVSGTTAALPHSWGALKTIYR